MIRLFDIFFSLFGIIFFFPLLILLWIISLFDVGSPIFFQERVGYDQKIFKLIKFRTMPLNTKSVGTHLVRNIKFSSFAIFLRNSKLDEIPQLFNVFLGDMSLVGPRPCLLSQQKLINERKKRGVFRVRPGITGLAQVKSITMKTPTLLAKTDLQMNKQMNLYYYFYYIFMTILIVFKIK
jgi:lipopolysaccharide/colanic/teichoic acid biosynthesis glycosyltransferase